MFSMLTKNNQKNSSIRYTFFSVNGKDVVRIISILMHFHLEEYHNAFANSYIFRVRLGVRKVIIKYPYPMGITHIIKKRRKQVRARKT